MKIHDELADALIPVLEAVGVRTAFKWSPGAIKPPSAVIEMPTIRRIEADQAEDHVGAKDWHIDFPVLFYVELTKDTRVQLTQAELVQLAVDFINAIDNLQSDTDGFILNGLCTDAKVISAEPFATPSPDEGSRNQLGYETHVSVLTFQ